ncbi:PAS domain-containing protein [Phreatobacter stygius]|uniref:PAS domain-containing protein n=1 Tax=Phreatobacter stygius TaxID=1940610 RepID=A0A4D7ANQ7_9HYPH|nr:PAS domain-containing protein [Phreatobacter stygius]QCI62804.1 PAS domain-containing protein [Phreatobacter stygius]
MRHAASRTLFNYWDGLRAGGIAPDRADIEPRGIAGILGDTFILETDRLGVVPYRLAGSRVCAIFGQEMKGLPFLGHFTGQDRARVAQGLADANAAPTGLLIAAEGISAAGQTVPLELVVLPLAHRGRIGARMVGVISMLESPYWIGRDEITELKVVHVKLIWPNWQDQQPAQPRVAIANAASSAISAVFPSRPALRVIEGGRMA